MSRWLFENLKKTEEYYPNPIYAFNSTVNWMRSIQMVCEDRINVESLHNFYPKVMKKTTNPEYVGKSMACVFSSLNYLQALSYLANNDDRSQNAINSHIAIVTWYYCIYNAAKAMIAIFNSSYQENHTKTATAFHELVENRCLIMEPFNYFISDITDKNIKEQITCLRNGLKIGRSLEKDHYPQNDNIALDCIFSYLKGTAEYKQDNVKKDLIKTDEFKKNFKSFRTKDAREFRDKKFSKQKVNFLNQAFRYRGKANYRDCIYLMENQSDMRLNFFINDLEIVANKFFMMASFYVSKRIDQKKWNEFAESLDSNSKAYLSN